MSHMPFIAYVDGAGNPPTDPVVGNLPSSDSDRLAAILAAIGLDVVPTPEAASSDASSAPQSPAKLSAGVAAVYRAAAPGVRWSIVSHADVPILRKEVHYFLANGISPRFDAALAAGASALSSPDRTSFGIRFAVADADGRKFVVTERGTETVGTPLPDDDEATSPAPFDLPPPDRRERRLLRVQRWGIGASLLGTLLLIAAALFLSYLTIVFDPYRVPHEAVRAWSLTIPIVWTCGLVFLLGGRLALLLDPGRAVGMWLLIWVLLLDAVNLPCSMLLWRAGEPPWFGLFFFYLSAITFTRYLVVAARDLRADRAARAADWANSGFMLVLLVWMGELFVVEMFVRWPGLWRRAIYLTFQVPFLLANGLLVFALFRFARHSADRLFRTVEIDAIRSSPHDPPNT